jgi:hypothetical protein
MTAFALKEWEVVCQALSGGRQWLTLRKGGIEEEEGEFRLRYPAFYLYPTREHQKLSALRPEFASISPAGPSGLLHLALYAESLAVRLVESEAQARALARWTVWTDEAMAERWRLYPGKPLLAVLLRVYRLRQPLTVPDDPSYAGCRSWVPLVDVAPPHRPDLEPVLNESVLEEAVRKVDQAMADTRGQTGQN